MMNRAACWLFTAMTGFVILVSSTNAEVNNCTTDALQSNGPIITPCQKEFILQKGQNFTLSCKGKRKLQFKQQEPSEENNGIFSMNQTLKTTSDAAYPFESILELYNVDQYAIGYYACFDDTLVASDVLKELTEEPNDNEHISYTYIYVDGTHSLFAPMSELVILYKSSSKVIIECRPSTPDVAVSLMSEIEASYSPKIGFVVDFDYLSDDELNDFHCSFVKRDEWTEQSVYIQKQVKVPPTPTVTSDSKWFLKDKSFTINCTVEYNGTSAIDLKWIYPNDIPKETVVKKSNEYEIIHDILYSAITIENATIAHNGSYTCVAENSCGSKAKSFFKNYTATPFVTLTKINKKAVYETAQRLITLQATLEACPEVREILYLRNNKTFKPDAPKYSVQRTDISDIVLKIKNLNVTDTGIYTIVAKNEYTSDEASFDVRIIAPPVVSLGPEKRGMENSHVSFECKSVGYKLPTISWSFSDGENNTNLTTTKLIPRSLYESIAYLDVPVHKSGNITCTGTNDKGEKDSKTSQLLLLDIPNGFGIKNSHDTWFSKNDNVAMQCVASIYDFVNVTWIGSDGQMLQEKRVEYSKRSYSYFAVLKLDNISLEDAGDYKCRGTTTNGSEKYESISITVADLRNVVISEPTADSDVGVELFHPINLYCQADGVPPPEIEWYKDGEKITSIVNGTILKSRVNNSTVNSTIEIQRMNEDNAGTYECEATSKTDTTKKTYTLFIKADASMTPYIIVIAVIFVALIFILVYLVWKVKMEKQFRKELAAAGLLYFKEGVTKSLNPDLGIDEQAELLPYDERFEFPPDKLVIGKQLGAGAFGVVYKAEARGIINAEETTLVAVKMVKKTADNMYIKALASELKIMVHLGKHVNIVNLLGACTKNVGKRELSVIVEYCKFGNIHNYMQRHREVFIDQLTDNKENNLGKVNQGFLCSNGSAGAQSDYFGSTNTQDTDHTFVNTANTSRSTRKDLPIPPVELKQVSEGYVQPEWRSNYETEYSFDGRNPRPLTSRDLLAWAFQIARGMEYLASRKVLHGDLAARNILLAEDNIVKICDFGLAKSIYKNDEYQKKENSPLPVKWLAIECMTDRIFSTQSDVWSFGIVLWELFSLAKTPYPNICPRNLLEWLSEGNRLEKPSFADDRLYKVMNRCWLLKPNARPSFSELQEILGTFLEDNVRNHYVDLNSTYMDSNVKQVGQEDYLAMVSAPDYNNMVTPSPHHYMNMSSSFFPLTPAPLDEEGYLQMSPAINQAIFSPRPQATTFDFDSRKLNPRASDASSVGSELTPMLTLNNLPARSGSESDHEGNVSPYLNGKCPRIDEADEVFEMKQNNTKNAQNTAVTNPTYITFDIDVIDKKPKDINSYVNMPNGLVK